MNEIRCPYKPCGGNTNCIGCMHDPKERGMPKEQFYDNNASIRCRDCKWYSVNNDRQESTCKRLDHKTVKFAVPYFKSYDCDAGGYCNDFEPSKHALWLYRHWRDEFKNEPKAGALVGLTINNDTTVRYYVLASDFYYNTFKNEDGTLKWVKKMHYKQSKNSPTGYVLVREYPNGKIEYHD